MSILATCDDFFQTFTSTTIMSLWVAWALRETDHFVALFIRQVFTTDSFILIGGKTNLYFYSTNAFIFFFFLKIK